MSFTQSQVDAHNARIAAGKARPSDQISSDAVPAGEEGSLHDEIITECRRRGWPYRRDRMDKPTTGQIGWPDFTILAPQGRVLLVECKTRAGKLTPEQLGLKLWAERLGHQIHVVRSFPDFLQVIHHFTDRPKP